MIGHMGADPIGRRSFANKNDGVPTQKFTQNGLYAT
jgi:hypothetical protein